MVWGALLLIPISVVLCFSACTKTTFEDPNPDPDPEPEPSEATFI